MDTGTKPIAEASARPASGVRLVLLGLSLALVATFLPLWAVSNVMDGSGFTAPEGSLPEGVFGEGGEVTWWGLLGLDVRDRIHITTVLLATWVPLAIVAMSAIVPLMVGWLRGSFGPLVLVAIAMWGAQVLMWGAVFQDNWGGEQLRIGSLILFLGLVIAGIGAVVDVRTHLAERAQVPPGIAPKVDSRGGISTLL